MNKVYFITGTSSGLARSLAEVVLERRDHAVLTARKTTTIAGLIGKYPKGATAAQLDVTEAVQRWRAVTGAMERFGRIDVLVKAVSGPSRNSLQSKSGVISK